ncbi:PREDICTED: uncharacterized protein LOC109480255 [Branchiostoma belcheri]|uniref:Uncharacterized protein LOC109480255 n=1 Tax=Branchiostoma belcheri TaxID=7741 RepID=A0A6P4ZMG3_BRABE|nr:PREDICTED: uncharacterized protein LOC109480255 [Branchiostoma belcheri]
MALSKPEYSVDELKPKAGGKPVKGSSIPLILPNDMKYNAATGGVEKVPDAQRTGLYVVPEASDLLEGIEEPVSVLAICGPCRTGKSYILSRMLGTADAFALGHRMDPETFGIWMGTKVLRGKDFTIVLLDTEGIDAVGASAGQDASILVLTILLSSQLIYNSQNVPRKGDLEKMQCFIKLATGITVKQGSRDVSGFRDFFPDFLWLLRDVTLKMENEDGNEMDPTEYLTKKVLKRDPGAFEESQNDKVGRVILTFFPTVECAKLVQPSGDVEVMRNIAQHTDNLNPEFNEGVNALTERLLQKSRAKRGYNKGSTVSGLALSIMTRQYVEAVNDPNAIPALDNTWQNTVELMTNKAIDEAVMEYKKQIQDRIAKARATENGEVPLEEDGASEENEATENDLNIPRQPTLMDLHHESFKEVTGRLLEKVGHFGISSESQGTDEQNSVAEKMQNRLVQREERTVDHVAADGSIQKKEGFVVTGGELFQYIQENKELSRGFCQKTFELLFGPIRVKGQSPPPDYDFKQLMEELEHAHKKYYEQARGPEKWVVLQEMTKDLKQLEANFNNIKGFEKKVLEEQQKAQEAEIKAREQEREAQQLNKQRDDMLKAQQETLEKVQQQHKEHMDKFEKQELERREKEEKKIQELTNALMHEQAQMAKERNEREKEKAMEMMKSMQQEQAANNRQMMELMGRILEKTAAPPLNMPGAHSKFGFRVEELQPKAGGKPVKGSSIPLILPNDMKYNAATGGVEKVRGKRTGLYVVPEALDLLEGIEEPVSVPAICGPARTGKSYILSRMLGTADAFALGHRTDPETFGIWMGTKVLRGKDFTIVLLDTEGIDAVGASASQDASILVLTILLSSQLIYNSQNVPRKGDLEKMQSFINLAKGITVNQGKRTDTSEVSALRKFFPDFLWLLRDVTLKMEDDHGNEIHPTEYLKTKVLGIQHEKGSTSDKVRQAILNFFPSVECATLERPSGDVDIMSSIAHNTDNLNPGFNKGVENLIQMLIQKARPKRGCHEGSTVNGEALSIMTKQYVEAVNNPNAIPALDNTWQHTVELMTNKAIEEAVKEYKKRMQDRIAKARATENGEVPLEEDGASEENEATENDLQPTLMDLHHESFKEVTGRLLEKVGHFGISSESQGTDEQNSVAEKMQNRLVQREERTVEYVTCTEDGTSRKQKRFVVTGGELFQYVQKNKDLSRVFCKRLFERLLGPISKRVESPAADYELQQFMEELDSARQQYKEQARGPEKWIVLQEMTPNVDKLKAKFETIVYQRRILQEQQRALEAELRATELESEMNKLIQQAQDVEQNRLENMQQMDRLLQTYQHEISQLKHQIEEQKDDALKTIQELQAKHMEQQVEMERVRSERELSRFDRVIQQMEQQMADMQREMEELKKQPPRPPTPPPPPPKEQKCTIL